MITIAKAKIEDSELIASIGKQTFLESHGHSAPATDIKLYVNANYNDKAFKEELCNPKNLYNIIYYNKHIVGYSKIILDQENKNIQEANVSKLDRLYVLESFHGLKLGLELFSYNMNLSKQNKQSGMWLFVWTENHRAIAFYKKVGFNIVGRYNFKISKTHSNPNHQMFLKY